MDNGYITCLHVSGYDKTNMENPFPQTEVAVFHEEDRLRHNGSPLISSWSPEIS